MAQQLFGDLFPSSTREFSPEDSKFMTREEKETLAATGEPFAIRDVIYRPAKMVTKKDGTQIRIDAQWSYEVYMVERNDKVKQFELPTDGNGRDDQAKKLQEWLKLEYNRKPADKVRCPISSLERKGNYYRITSARMTERPLPEVGEAEDMTESQVEATVDGGSNGDDIPF